MVEAEGGKSVKQQWYHLLNFILMTKNMCTFLLGAVTGVGLGMLIDDKNKKRLQKIIAHQFDCMHKQYTALRDKGMGKIIENVE